MQVRGLWRRKGDMALGYEKLEADVRKLQFENTTLLSGLSAATSQLNQQNKSVQSLLVTQASTPGVPVANLLWNGELAHSSWSWHEITLPPTIPDTDQEAAFWFSNNAPATSQTFTTITTANQIPLPNHNFTTGCVADVTTTGTLPTGLAIVTTYYVYVLNANVVQLATTVALAEAGTPDVTIGAGTGSGTHTLQPLLVNTDSYTSLFNNELKDFDHTHYDPRYSRWNLPAGEAEMTGTTTVDTALPSNMISSQTPLARVSLIAAKKNAYIEITDACLMFAGIWDNTSGQRKFLTGGVGFAATLAGTAGTVVRKYRILITSDKGFSILSDEITISNGPSDAQFSSSRNVLLSWGTQAGQLQVDVYCYLPNGGTGSGSPEYRLLTQISSATSYIDEGAYLPRTVSSYPSSTQTLRTAAFFTSTGDIAGMAINGVALNWDTINFPIGVPNNYNMANTTDRQWLRLGLTVAPNIWITSGVTTNGTTTLTIPDGAVDSSAVNLGGYGTGSGSLYAGLTVQIYDSTDVLLTTTTITSVTSNTVLVLAASVATGTDRKLRIVGGGFHGVFIDKINLGYQTNTAYTPNSYDIRTLNPLSAPHSSDQGTTGGGGSGGGINTCICEGTLILMADGTEKAVETCVPGDMLASGGFRPNVLVKMREGKSKVRSVHTANGCRIICTDTEAFMVNPLDGTGAPLHRLRVGDTIYTYIDRRIEETTISDISGYLPDKRKVYTPSLDGNHIFIANGLLAHNMKPLDGSDPGGVLPAF